MLPLMLLIKLTLEEDSKEPNLTVNTGETAAILHRSPMATNQETNQEPNSTPSLSSLSVETAPSAQDVNTWDHSSSSRLDMITTQPNAQDVMEL